MGSRSAVVITVCGFDCPLTAATRATPFVLLVCGSEVRAELRARRHPFVTAGVDRRGRPRSCRQEPTRLDRYRRRVFDAIVLRSTTDPQSEPLDLGLLAEALMFYGTVDLVLNRAFLNQLMNALGPDELVEFTQLDGIKVSYCNQFDVVLTENTGTVAERYFLGTAEMPHTRLDQLSTELFRGA